MGTCTAYAPAKKGYKVALLEQFAFLHRKGSSHGESRIMRKPLDLQQLQGGLDYSSTRVEGEGWATPRSLASSRSGRQTAGVNGILAHKRCEEEAEGRGSRLRATNEASTAL